MGGEKITISNDILRDMYSVADYRIGTYTIEKAKDKVVSNYGKTLLLVVWATKLENQDNVLGRVYDNDLFTLRNIWQLRSLDSLNLFREEIIAYASSIPIDGISNCIDCLTDNVEFELLPCRDSFIDVFSNTFNERNFFHWIDNSICPVSWQERTVLALVNNGIRQCEYNIHFIFSNDETKEEIEQRLSEVKDYFSNPQIDFIIETVLLFSYCIEPSFESKLKYFRLWTEIYQDAEEPNKYSNLGYYGVSKLFSCLMCKSVAKTDEYKQFINVLHEIKQIHELKRLQAAHFPLCNEQKDIIKQYRLSACQRISEIDDVYHFMDYLKDDNVQKSMDELTFMKVEEKSLKFIEDEANIRILPSLFYAYMVFLLRIKNAGSIPKRMIDYAIIDTQNLWETKYYYIVIENMSCFSAGIQFSRDVIERHNKEVLKNPCLFAQECIKLDEEDVCSIMEDVSENPAKYMFARMEISKFYPISNSSVCLDRHDVDVLLQEYISKVAERNSFRFLNRLSDDNYMSAVHEDIQNRSQLLITMFHDEEELYGLLQKEYGEQLLPYDSNIKLGHVTQLFPILEKKIRTLSSLFGFVPFKQDNNALTQYKDPSSLLREMIEEVYRETSSFSIISDLMFVYCLMYNSNSFNIRNECIHGRGYDTERELRFAFRATLLSIYMMDHRYRLAISKGQQTDDDCTVEN